MPRKIQKSDKDIKKAILGSPDKLLTLGDRKIQCYVLEDGTAVLSGRGMQDALNLGQGHGTKLTKLLENKVIKPLIDSELAMVLENPIRFTRPGRGGIVAKGYEATTLTKICRVILKARREGELKNNDYLQQIADECEIIVAAFSDVGIIATIYEITGYEKIKDRDMYQKYVEKFIRKEYAAWVKRFPIRFFELMSDLKGWRYEKNKTKYYPAMGHIINDVVYKRLAPNILKELNKVNPVNEETGTRKVKHHMWLTDEVGIPSLAEHLIGVMALASANTEWRKFYSQLNKAYPLFNNPQLYLFPPEEIPELLE
ncbi:MAG: P63C domain-containing protein [Flavisolibacter sp.]